VFCHHSSCLHAKNKTVAVKMQIVILKCFIVVDMFACMLLKNKRDAVFYMLSSFYYYIQSFLVFVTNLGQIHDSRFAILDVCRCTV